VQGAVELAIALAVEPVPAGAAGGHRSTRCLTAWRRLLRCGSAGVGERQQELGGAERTQAVQAQVWSAYAVISASSSRPSRHRVLVRTADVSGDRAAVEWWASWTE